MRQQRHASTLDDTWILAVQGILECPQQMSDMGTFIAEEILVAAGGPRQGCGARLDA